MTLKALILASALVATPLLAQANPTLDQRVGKVEKQLKAVQRKVFPGGEPIEPDTAPAATTPDGAPVQSPIADLTARVDAIEKSLAALTGQVETQGNRLHIVEDQLKAQTTPAPAPVAATDTESAPVSGNTAETAPPPEPVITPVRRPAATVPASPSATAAGARTVAARRAAVSAVEVPATGDAAEDMYSYGFRLYQAQLFPEAEASMKDYAAKYPRGKRISFARNLLGRAYLDDGKPALASMAFLDNYQKDAKGERAAESLSWLGTALIRLGKKPDACRVYDEFDDVYGAKAAADVRQRVTRGRSEAGCTK
ncbi:TolA-binding protein [Sphingomonas antarctica]|uniref:tetratricopeptide repeat protein n=1 Tax=Sphingomonas antarctica TaxID=2040274 RepID=UPI0039E9839D